ncbi:AAA family ATPase [Corynebacterium sp.]|uniref:AAA family ATPase n=1 Tax=Corynebacterium sp. TaxID=1720 RepID=UPI0025C19BEE|nr:AAA family ATPase [Corynebacterium sp.]
MTTMLPEARNARKLDLEQKFANDQITDDEMDEYIALVTEDKAPDYIPPDMGAAARRHDRTHPRYEGNKRRIKTTRAADIRTERIDWLVDCWIPKASVTLLAGREGIGKSTIAVDWAAQATTGKLSGTPMNVGYVVTEDSRSHTVVPRLKAAGADLERVLFLDADMPDDDDPTVRYEGVLDLPQDFPILADTIRENNIGLLILDAAKSVMSSKLDGNSDTAIRQFLEPMHRTAQDTGCTFIGLAHFGKRETADTGKLILGSSAWSQVARSVISVAADPDTGTVKVWNSKANLAPRTRTVEAEVVTETIRTDDGQETDVGRIRWGAECDEDGSSLLAPENERAPDDEDEVRMVVLDYLEAHGGNAPANEVLKATRAAGLNDGTVKNKRRKIGITTRKVGKDWMWSVESSPGGKVIPFPSRSDLRDLVTFAGQGAKEDHNEDHNEDHDQDHAGEDHNEDHSPENAVTSEDNKITKVTREGSGDDLESAVLAALSPEFPQTLGKVMRAVKNTTGDGSSTGAELDRLVAEGRVTERDGRYTLA